MKPQAPAEIRGPYKPIATSVPGVHWSTGTLEEPGPAVFGIEVFPRSHPPNDQFPGAARIKFRKYVLPKPIHKSIQRLLPFDFSPPFVHAAEDHKQIGNLAKPTHELSSQLFEAFNASKVKMV